MRPDTGTYLVFAMVVRFEPLVVAELAWRCRISVADRLSLLRVTVTGRGPGDFGDFPLLCLRRRGLSCV